MGGEESGGAAATLTSTSSPTATPNHQLQLTVAQLSAYFSPHDMARLESYAKGHLDYHVISDLLPAIARLAFGHSCHLKLPGFTPLPRLQAAILLALGLQRVDAESAGNALSLASNQVLALLTKAVRKVTTSLGILVEAAAAGEWDKKVAAGASILDGRSTAVSKGYNSAAEGALGTEGKKNKLSSAALQSIMQDPELGRYVVPGDALENALKSSGGEGGVRKQSRLGEAIEKIGEGSIPSHVSLKRQGGGEEGEEEVKNRKADKHKKHRK